MSKKVFVVGVGMTKFLKPSADNPDYPEMAKTAINRALMDAGMDYKKVEAAIVGYVYGDSTCGNRYNTSYSELSMRSECQESQSTMSTTTVPQDQVPSILQKIWLLVEFTAVSLLLVSRRWPEVPCQLDSRIGPVPFNIYLRKQWS